MAKECRYYRLLADGRIECTLCPHHCRITEGKTGVCRSRRNLNGVLVSEVYGKPCALAIDPIEKKPLYHFHPGTKCLSLACTGCNFRCLNCQNHDISQVSPLDVNHYDLSPDDIVALCKKHHCPGIAYTYTEPLTYLEYIIDCARLAHEAGIWNILVTAGYVCQEPLADLLPYLDAANIDLKSFSDDIYMKVCGGHLQPVLDTIIAMKQAGVWVEITNLVIPGINVQTHRVCSDGQVVKEGTKDNDDLEMIRQMCRWLNENGLAEVPLHFSRFFPRYKLQHVPPTPLQTLRAAKQVAEEEGIKYIYLGNV